MKPNGKPPRCFQLARALSVTVDVLIFLLAAATLVFIEFYAGNVKRGFFCGDKSIAFKRQKDTISIKTVILFGLSPILVMWIVEFIFNEQLEDDENTFKHRLRKSGRKTLRWFKHFGINLVLMLLVMDVSKVLIGSHRPHFLETCQPNAAVHCVDGEFISDFECTNKNVSSYSLRDSSRSFPSGHACISMYTALFLIWYLQCRIPKLQSMFLIPFMQSLLMVWVCLCSISRITDHRHHWWDVLGGALLGVTFAVYTCHILSNNFCDDKQKSNVLNSNGSDSARRSRRTLLSTIGGKDEFTLNNLE